MLISSHWMDQIVISVHISSSCNILFQGVRNVPQSILYALYWFIYSLCVYVQQCLGEESVLNLKNFCQQLLIMKLVQNKPTKPNDNVSSCYFQLSHFVMTMYHRVTSSCPFCNDNVSSCYFQLSIL